MSWFYTFKQIKLSWDGPIRIRGTNNYTSRPMTWQMIWQLWVWASKFR